MVIKFIGFRLITGTIFLSCLFTACDKDDEKVDTIDVSTQWYFDSNGVVVFSPNDKQWQQQSFTSKEMALFQSLDTANLSGTTMPAAARNILNYLFPNPFQNYQTIAFGFNEEFSGTVKLKYVLVDSLFNPVQKLVTDLTATSGRMTVSIAPDIASGKYRAYYTLSAEGNPHFFKSWGNIQKL